MKSCTRNRTTPSWPVASGWKAAWKNRIDLDLCIHGVDPVAVPVSQRRSVSEHQALEWLTKKAAESLFLETLTWTRPEQLDVSPWCFQQGVRLNTL